MSLSRPYELSICLALVASAAGPIVPASTQTHTIRDGAGKPPCIVGRTDGPRGSDLVTVSFRAPGQPADEDLAGLSRDRRDFSALPARVVLQSPPEAGGNSPVERRPTSVEAGVIYPVIDGAVSSEPYVRATFPRAWLVAGTTIVAERAAKAADGTRVVAQSVCRIGEKDAVAIRAPAK